MSTVISKDGTEIAYDKVGGEHPPLIYVNGALCYKTFEPVIHDAQVFSQKFSVYIYDRRGRGNSGNTLPYSVDREVEDIEALIDNAGGSAYVYGHSSGANLALEAALKLPDKVTKVAMYEPPYAVDKKSLKESEAFIKELREILDKKKYSDAVAYFMQSVGMPDSMIHEIKVSPNWPILESLAPTLLYDNDNLGGVTPTSRAAHLQVSALLMYGLKSFDFMEKVSQDLHNAIPHSQLHPLAGQNHNPSANAILPILSKFFLN